MNIKHFLASINPFHNASATELAKQQLADAQRAFLEHVSAAEFHDAQATYYQGMIVRLTEYLKGGV